MKKSRKRNKKTQRVRTQTITQTANRQYKSRLFELIFRQKKELLELYNAMSGKNYTDPELLEINTLENAIYMSMHNDLSFVVDLQLYLYEHQSTYNPNIPLRNLLYISDLYSNIIKKQSIYGRKRLEIPTPHFVVFYNGIEKRPEREIIKLSEMFSVQEEEKQLELIVTILNINIGYNRNLMDSCRTLKDYCEYNRRIREYLADLSLEDAVEKAITECIREGILSEFLQKNRAEAKKVSIYEFDEELFARQTRQEGYEEGVEVGIEKGIEKGIQKGKESHIAELIQKKLARGKDIPTIADELEEDVCVIEEKIKQMETDGES